MPFEHSARVRILGELCDCSAQHLRVGDCQLGDREREPVVPNELSGLLGRLWQACFGEETTDHGLAIAERGAVAVGIWAQSFTQAVYVHHSCRDRVPTDAAKVTRHLSEPRPGPRWLGRW